MKRQLFPAWLFDAASSEARGEAANTMFAALGEGNKPAYLGALASWQAASGGCKGCPAALGQCPWNPPETDVNATAITTDSEGFYCLGGMRLPFA